jgi:lysophospholipase L1-like esterase
MFGALDTGDLVGGDDCLHPDDSGHAAIAEAFADAILDS